MKRRKAPAIVRSTMTAKMSDSRPASLQKKVTKKPDQLTRVVPDAIIRRRLMSISGASSRGSHQLTDALSCSRKWWLRYLKGWRPRYSNENLVAGTLVHTYLAYWLGEQLPKRPKFLDRPLAEQIEEDSEGFPLLVAQAQDVARYVQSSVEMGYFPLNPAGVEHEFRAPLGELAEMLGLSVPSDVRDEVVTSRVDLLSWDPGGQTISIIDHKTVGRGGRTGRLGNWYPIQYHGLQMYLNLMLARAAMRKHNGPPVAAFRVHRIKRVPPYDRSIDLMPEVGALMNAAFEMACAAVQAERRITEMTGQGLNAPMNLGACNGRGHPCDYFAICGQHTEQEREEALRRSFIQIGDVSQKANQLAVNGDTGQGLAAGEDTPKATTKFKLSTEEVDRIFAKL